MQDPLDHFGILQNFYVHLDMIEKYNELVENPLYWSRLMS